MKTGYEDTEQKLILKHFAIPIWLQLVIYNAWCDSNQNRDSKHLIIILQ